jgi:hypothetical protein
MEEVEEEVAESDLTCLNRMEEFEEEATEGGRVGKETLFTRFEEIETRMSDILMD